MKQENWPTNFGEEEIKQVTELSSSLASVLTFMSALSLGAAGLVYCVCYLLAMPALGVTAALVVYFVVAWMINKQKCRAAITSIFAGR